MASEWSAEEALVEEDGVRRAQVREGLDADQARRGIGLVDPVQPVLGDDRGATL